MSSNARIRDILQLILKKKILMSFIVENYSRKNKYYNFTLMVIAGIPIALGVVSNIIQRLADIHENNSGGAKSSGAIIDIIIVIFNAMIVGLIKLKDMLKYDKVCDAAKEQSIRYGQLYDKITASRDKRDTEFLYLASREYGIIEGNDPEISESVKARFIKNCEERGIMYDDDYMKLKKISEEDGATGNSSTGDASNYSFENALSENESDRSVYIDMRENYDNKASIKWAIDRLRDERKN